MPPKYLTTAEVAERYRTAESTVRYWRMIKYGPKGVRVGRKILYAIEACDEFDRLIQQDAEVAPKKAS